MNGITPEMAAMIASQGGQQMIADPVEIAREEAKKNLAFVRQAEMRQDFMKQFQERIAEMQKEMASLDSDEKKPGKQSNPEMEAMFAQMLGINQGY